MTLLAKQFAFSRYLGHLLLYAAQVGIPVTLGEAWRTPEQAEWNVQKGLGISKSLHLIRLAVDLNCHRRTLSGDHIYLDQGDEPEYTQLGAYWKSLHPDCTWGGDFHPKPDPGHFSITHNGRK